MSDIGEKLVDLLEQKFTAGVSVVVKTTGKGLKDIVSEACTKCIDKCRYNNGTLTEMAPMDFVKKYHTRALSNVVIPDKDVQEFKKELVRHGVDFTILCDKTKTDAFGKPAEYEFVYLGSNIEQIHKSLSNVFGEFAHKLVSAHKPLEAVQLKDAAERVSLQTERMQEHQVSGRGAR